MAVAFGEPMMALAGRSQILAAQPPKVTRQEGAWSTASRRKTKGASPEGL